VRSPENYPHDGETLRQILGGCRQPSLQDEEIKALKLKCDSYERTILQAGDQLKSGLI